MNAFKRGMIFVTFFGCCFGMALMSAALGTKFWFEGAALQKDVATNFTRFREEASGRIHFGLFKGVKILNWGIGDRTQPFSVVCLEGLCMYSFGSNKSEREDSLRNIIYGGVQVPTALLQEEDEHIVVDDHGKAELSATKYEFALPYKKPPHGKAGNMSEVVPDLMNEGLWIATIISLSAGLLFAVVGAIFAVINTATTPIEILTGIPGLYIWNASAAFFAVLSIILWAVQYHIYMMNNVLIEDQVDGWTTVGFEHLGYSFWLVLVAAFLHALNCILIFIATYEKKARTQYEAPETKPGNSMLY